MPRKYKVLFVDLDGTLLNSSHEISERSVTAAKKSTAAGVSVVIATARPPRSARRFYERLGLATPSINYNGAEIVNFHENKVLQHHPIESELARHLYDRLLAFDRSAYVSLEVCDRWYVNIKPEKPMTETEREGFEPDFVGNLYEVLDQPVTKILASFPHRDANDVQNELSDEFDQALSFTKSEEGVVQVMAGGVTKGAAAGSVMQMLGVQPQECVAVGDAPNDISMLKVVGLAIAVAGAYPETKAAADYITLSNDEDGVAAAIEKFLLP